VINTASKPWLNPSLEQERAWQQQRQAALASTRQAVAEALRLGSRQARLKFLAAYREKHGAVCAAALEQLVKSGWEKRRA
jgi:2-oxo-4-hydroxy-4-carboxy--5-ureidoimidazoline (OHCU) decarboxylase